MEMRGNYCESPQTNKHRVPAFISFHELFVGAIPSFSLLKSSPLFCEHVEQRFSKHSAFFIGTTVKRASKRLVLV